MSSSELPSSGSVQLEAEIPSTREEDADPGNTLGVASLVLPAEAQLGALGIDLPGPHLPSAPLLAVIRASDRARTSGQLPRLAGRVTCVGRLGEDVTIEAGRAAARLCVLNALSVLREELGTLDRVERVLSILGFVASAPGFNRQPEVMDGASAVLVDIFGEVGRHTRSAIGVVALPRGAAVEVELEVALRPHSS